MEQFNDDSQSDKDGFDSTDLSVGEILRRSRKQRGQSLRDISNALRIRPQQLEALEKGEWHRLPGQVYIIGFVRSYAEYLGLDGEKMIKLLKMQSNGFTRLKPKLSFPSPPSENRAPGWGAVMVAILMIFGAIYAWESYKPEKRAPYDLADIGKDVSEVIQPISDEKASLDKQDSLQDLPVISPDTPDDLVSTKLKEEQEIAKTKQKNEGIQDEPSDDNEVKPVDNSGTNTYVKVADKQIEEKVGLSTSVDKKKAAAQERTLDETAERPFQEASAKISAKTSGGIVLKSTFDSWVEISRRKGEPLYSGMLSAGDQYIVPQEKENLSLTIGNAGAVRVFVDGEDLGKLGKQGDIIRGIELTGLELKRRTQKN